MEQVSAITRLQIVSKYWLKVNDIMQFLGCGRTKAQEIKKGIITSHPIKSPFTTAICYQDLLEFLHIDMNELERMATIEKQYVGR